MKAEEFEEELEKIRRYWVRYTVDEVNGGFYGQVDNHNTADPQAPKGAVLNARILWFFSAAYQHKPLPETLELAWRSYYYLRDHFLDKEYGGVFWSVDFEGKPLNTKKQIYALAFAIYGMTEFYRITKNDEALELAVSLYHAIEKYSFDPVKNGYFEAFSRQWTGLEDLRLSRKDANEKKTMNTHLHIVEAYSNLYAVWPDEELGRRIRNLLYLFTDRILDGKTGHLNLFFDEDWHPKSEIISFGHDIEASWLLLEAAETLGDEALIRPFTDLAVKMAVAVIPGLDENGGLSYEEEKGKRNGQKHWWVQAEALVGFFNACQITGDPAFRRRAEKCWDFIRTAVSDHRHGEWFWGVNEDLSVMGSEDKVGMWKCPYHNGRACLEMIRRLG